MEKPVEVGESRLEGEEVITNMPWRETSWPIFQTWEIDLLYPCFSTWFSDFPL